jgi:hypothetical protein
MQDSAIQHMKLERIESQCPEASGHLIGTGIRALRLGTTVIKTHLSSWQKINDGTNVVVLGLR